MALSLSLVREAALAYGEKAQARETAVAAE